MSHGAVNVLQDFSCVAWAVAQELLDFFTYSYCFHLHSPPCHADMTFVSGPQEHGSLTTAQVGKKDNL